MAVAWRDLPDGHAEDDITRDFTYAGLIGMIDPLRDEARDTITTCREAGIRAIMITGDQQATAAEIARQLGLNVDPQGRALRTVHARELADLDDDGWLKAVDDAAVFARVSPEHKLRIVDALQRQGHVVAMTGDGVNDAPALRQADIGIAMGIRGTEVAKESAAMVITDDNFATIVRAVEQGRIIVHNILRFIHYLFSCNFAEIMTVFTAIMLGWPLPLGVLQILWLNLLLAACTLGAFAVGMRWYGTEGEALRHAVTIAFMTLAMAQVLHAFNARSRTESAFSSRLFTNGWLWGAVVVCVGLQLAAVYIGGLRDVLGTVALNAGDWGVVAAGSALPVAVVEAVKAVQRRGTLPRTP